MKFALAASLFAAIVVEPVTAGECGTFGTDFGACLNWCSDTNPGAERYIIDGCYRAVCSSCRPAKERYATLRILLFLLPYPSHFRSVDIDTPFGSVAGRLKVTFGLPRIPDRKISQIVLPR
ncbi:hypothetical protein CSAL01_13504 [Colletotrichum salicis]|uniref:Uncharacterized protein n=1 Tax=Colletotrichum salicis TaxID=1209931 RepID=A0A135VAA1_9PEZI|nr:hypothetical protein CSAL01_13504 [Colletotrichum salicis]